MDTEEERPDIVNDGTQAEVNALRNLLSQLGDPDAAHEASVIDDDSYIEQKANKMAYTAALAAYDSGGTPDVAALLVPDSQLVAAKHPAVNLPKGLVGLLSGAG